MPAAWELNNNSPQMIVGMPHRGNVPIEWALAFRNIQIPVNAMFTTSAGTPIDMARNEIVRSAQERGVEWIFFLDTDVIPPPDVVPRLMGHDLPIVSGLYYTRAPPIEPCVWEESAPNQKRVKPFAPGSLVECEFIGAGCLLVHTSVFDRIEKPYFEWTLSFEDPEKFNVGRSEDFQWCRKVRERGYKVFVDTSIVCKHAISNAYAIDGRIEASPI